MVSIPTKRQLERLAASYGVTQREMLERALAGAERQVLEALPSKAQDDDFEWGSVPAHNTRAAEAGAGGSAPPVSFHEIEYDTHEVIEVNRQRVASDPRVQAYLQTWRSMFPGAVEIDVYQEVDLGKPAR